MSYTVSDKNEIRLTRGDTLKCTILLKDENGKDYIPDEGDVVNFALRHSAMNSKRTAYKDEEPLIEKEVPTSTMLLQLNPEDTESLEFGDYVYDVEITFEDGSVDTFITETAFTITPEVHINRSHGYES